MKGGKVQTPTPLGGKKKKQSIRRDRGKTGVSRGREASGASERVEAMSAMALPGPRERRDFCLTRWK